MGKEPKKIDCNIIGSPIMTTKKASNGIALPIILTIRKPFVVKRDCIVKVVEGQTAFIYVDDKPYLRYSDVGEYRLYEEDNGLSEKIVKVVYFNRAEGPFESHAGFGNVKLAIPNCVTEVEFGAAFKFYYKIEDITKLIDFFYRKEIVTAEDITTTVFSSSKDSLINVTQNLFSEVGIDWLANNHSDRYFKWIENYYRFNPLIKKMGVEIIDFQGLGCHVSQEDYNALIKEINLKNEECQPDDDNTNKYIFISYSHKDSNAVLPIIQELQNSYNIWYDEGIDPGTEWDENIAKHINECDFFIACMTKNYINSSNCKDELNYARDLDKKRLIIYFEKVELPSGMKMRLNRLQSIHKYAYNADEDYYLKLAQSDGILQCKKANCNIYMGVAEMKNKLETKISLQSN